MEDIQEKANFIASHPEELQKLLDTLNFYGSGDFYEWDGCHCHGHYEFEKGGRAEDALYEFSNAFTNYQWEKEEKEMP